MWVEKIRKYSKNIRFININPPATDNEIQEVINTLGDIPDDLKKLLKEINGDNFVLFSTDQIVEENIRLREMIEFMPLDCLLFFAGNGCGDYYGYQIRKDGICSYNIFLWDLEYDNRTWVAGSMDTVMVRCETVNKIFL